MTTRVSIPFWPQSTDNVCWSQDNLIAIAGTETIAILVAKPKIRSKDECKWEQVTFKINVFNEEELHVIEPLGFASWSASEELCTRFVENMQWSPSGLGMFGSCCLAILHADFSVDIWECRGRPEVRDSWQKCLTLNGVLYDHYAERLRDADDAYNRVQVSQRIRCMAWQPDSPSSSDQAQIQRLAVATVAGDIFVMLISSPYDITAPTERTWTVTIESHCSIKEHLPRDAVADQLLWIHQNDDTDTFVVLAGRILHYFHTSPGPEGGVRGRHSTYKQLTTNVNVEGPIRASRDGHTLFYYIDNMLVKHDLRSNEAQSQSLARGWSEMSGLALRPSQDSNCFEVFPVPLTGYEKLQSSKYDYPQAHSLDTTQANHDALLEPLNDAVKEFIVRQEIRGTIQTRSYGIAMSPLSSHVAYCTMMLPAEAPSHVIQGEQFSEIFICRLPEIEAFDDSVWQQPVENTVFTLQSYISASNDAVDEQRLIGHIARSIQQCLRRDVNDTLHARDQLDAVYKLRDRVVSCPERRQELERNLNSIITLQRFNAATPGTLYPVLISTVLEVLGRSEQYTDQLTGKVLAIYDWLWTRLRPDQDDAMSASDDTQEQCSICGQMMIFEAMKWARCPANHRFTRCALTFLAIPQLEKSKHCLLCGTQYLNEYVIPELHSERPVVNEDSQMINGHDQPSQELSALRILFAAFTRCLFCNGRFVTG